jgi:hypothetical protein
MNDLASVLTSVRERIAKFRGQAIGEENTKHALIEPVLKALGWDAEDLDEVRCEYRYKGGADPVDYALLQLGTPRLFVEAKTLGENLDKWANQVMGYAAVAGVGWVVLTDGNEYRIYNAGSSGDLEKKLFRRVVVASDEPGAGESLALLSKDQVQENRIEVIWRAEKVDRQVKNAVERLFSPASDAPADFLHLIRKRAPDLSLADVRGSLGRARFILEYPAIQPGPPPRGVQQSPPQHSADGHPGSAAEVKPGGHGDKTPWRHVTLQDLISAGAVHLPLDLETTYKGQHLTARIEAGGIVTWNATTYDSLSTAGGMARKSVIGAPPGHEYPQTNGWTFWCFRDADGTLVPLDRLRQRYAAR